jgi:hypothetical protein
MAALSRDESTGDLHRIPDEKTNTVLESRVILVRCNTRLHRAEITAVSRDSELGDRGNGGQNQQSPSKSRISSLECRAIRARAKGSWLQMTQVLAWLESHSVAVDVTAGRYYRAADLHE